MGLPLSFSSIVALISDSHRAAVSKLLAERTDPQERLLFAANSDELKRAVTSSSLVLIEGSRLSELAATGHIRETSHTAARVHTGDLVQRWLDALPAATRAVFTEALQNPRAWSVKRVAHHAGVSTRQLVRHCRLAQWTLPPKDLLLAARLASAQVALRGGRPRRVSQVAHDCGWIDARSLRAALRRAGFVSLDDFASFHDGVATVSELVARLHDRRT